MTLKIKLEVKYRIESSTDIQIAVCDSVCVSRGYLLTINSNQHIRNFSIDLKDLIEIKSVAILEP